MKTVYMVQNSRLKFLSEAYLEGMKTRQRVRRRPQPLSSEAYLEGMKTERLSPLFIISPFVRSLPRRNENPLFIISPFCITCVRSLPRRNENLIYLIIASFFVKSEAYLEGMKTLSICSENAFSSSSPKPTSKE